MSSRAEWPEYYDRNGAPKRPSSEADRPEWGRQECIDAGRTLAGLFAQNPAFGDSYLAVVKDFYATGQSGDFTDRYRDVIVPNVPGKSGSSPFNSHDFANVHRATWLWLLEGFSRLVDHNPHEPESWGDPPPGEISRGEEAIGAPADLFHNVPNSKGFFAISTSDIPAPTVTH